MKRSPRKRGASAAERAPRAAPKAKERLDVELVARGLTETREKAARLILAGQVVVDGHQIGRAHV